MSNIKRSVICGAVVLLLGSSIAFAQNESVVGGGAEGSQSSAMGANDGMRSDKMMMNKKMMMKKKMMMRKKHHGMMKNM